MASRRQRQTTVAEVTQSPVTVPAQIEASQTIQSAFPTSAPTLVPDLWSALFSKENPTGDNVPILERFIDARYVIYKIFVARNGNTRLMGYVQFQRPKCGLDLYEMNPTLRWTHQKYTTYTTVKYIKELKDGENRVPDYIELGEQWPSKIMTVQPREPDCITSPCV